MASQASASSASTPRLRTLQLTWPYGHTVALTLLLLGLFAGVAEVGLRLPWVQQRLPYTPVHSVGWDEYSVQLAGLDALVARQGRLDCLIIGSSVVLHGVDMPAFTQAFQAQTGRSLACARFALNGLVASQVDELAGALAMLYQPQWIIYPTEMRDFGVKEQARFAMLDTNLNLSSWLQYRLAGHFSIDGWLYEHSFAYRYIQGVLFISLRPAPTAEVIIPKLDVSQPPDPVSEAWWFDNFDTYSMSDPALMSFTAFLKLQPAGTQLVVVDMPIHPSFLLFFDHGAEYQQLYLDTLPPLTAAYGVPFWRVPPELTFPDHQWVDRLHLDPAGAVVFSAWLGERTALAVQRGELTLLTP